MIVGLTADLSIIERFEPVSLGLINGAKLLNRFDSKYWLRAESLPGILEEIKENYFVLQIGDSRIQKYRTIYFDTSDSSFYKLHHNGKSNRFKIRVREYINSGITFLEIKQKNNKGKTSKLRLQVDTAENEFSAEEKIFIQKNSICDADRLTMTSINSFKRITLVNRDFSERCTFDLNLTFNQNGSEILLDKLVIVELKQNSYNEKSKLTEVLKNNHLRPGGFSKYCIGRAITEPSLKKNRFKPKLLKIEREYIAR